MRPDECLLFVQAAIENGADIETANDDMHMIDNIFAVKRIHFMVHGTMKVTWRGNARKNQTLGDVLMDLIDGRINDEQESSHNS